MAVLSISALKVDGRNNGVNFTGNKRHKNYSPDVNNESVKSNKLAKVPVMLMIAMSPAMMNAKTPEQFIPSDEGNMIEMYEPTCVESNDATYVTKPGEPNNSFPFDIAFFRHKRIQQIVPAMAGGQKTNLVLSSSNFNDNTVRKVYLVKNNEKVIYETHEPQYITELVLHDIGKDKEYLGVTVLRDVFDKDTHEYRGTIEFETRLDDESAQFLLDFYAGSTKWKNITRIKLRVTTDPNLAPVKVY